jgi:hypothetical protein
MNFKKEVSKMIKTIKNTSSTQRQINPKIIANALGAEEAGVKIDTRQGPISLFSLRQFLVNRLRSSGGRPTLVGTIKKKRNKIPLFEGDWIKLESIAQYYKEKEGINVSPGQIASILLHTDVSKIASVLSDR